MRKFFASLFLFVSLSAFSELSGDVYSDWAASAPEALTIKILKVTPKATSEGQMVVVTAQVMDVQRSDSNLANGMTIVIQYEIIELAEDEAGVAPIPLLKVGTTVPAFLTQSGKIYKPAAEGHSFSKWLWDTQFN